MEEARSWELFWSSSNSFVKFFREYYFNRVFSGFVQGFASAEDTVLEVGCGQGSSRKYFKNYIGVDFCRQPLDGSKGFFVVGDVSHLPFKDSSIDVLWSQGLLEHLPNPEAAVREMYRVSRKNVVGIVPSLLFLPWYHLSRISPSLWPWMPQRFYSKEDVEMLVREYPTPAVTYLLKTFGLCIGFSIKKPRKTVLKDYYEHEGSLGVRMDLMYNNSNKFRNWYHNRRRELTERELVDLITPQSFYADIGCGEGQFIDYVRGKCKFMLACDLSSSYLKTVRKNKFESLLVNADVELLPFKSDSFDVVSCMETLEHVPDYVSALDELLRTSRKYVLITIPTERSNLVYNFARRLFGGRVSITDGFDRPFRGHIHSFKPDHIVDYAKKRKIKVKKIVPVHVLAVAPIMFFMAEKLTFLNSSPNFVVRAVDYIENHLNFMERKGISTIMVLEKRC